MIFGRKAAGGLLVVGGMAVLAASPVAANLRLEVRSRMVGLAHHQDPVAPFCVAPCYERATTERADRLTGHTEALP